MSRTRLIVEETTERSERTVRRVWVELPRPSRPTRMVDAEGETLPPPAKPALASCGVAGADVIPFPARRSA